MSNKKKIIIVLVIAVVSVLALVISGIKSKNNTKPESAKPQETQTEQKTEEKKEEQKAEEKEEKTEQNSQNTTENAQKSEDIKAKFMFYVSNADEKKEQALKAYEELKKEYQDKADFIVINIDEQPEMVHNFALPDETPKLILIGPDNEFSMKNNCADKEELKNELLKIIK